MNYIELTKLMHEQPWTFAKSMPRIPHHYTTIDEWEDKDAFRNVVKFIREKGYIENFWGKEYIYLKIGSYKYWTMGAPINKTIVINRALV